MYARKRSVLLTVFTLKELSERSLLPVVLCPAPVLWNRIGSDLHHFAGSGSVSIPNTCIFYFFHENFNVLPKVSKYRMWIGVVLMPIRISIHNIACWKQTFTEAPMFYWGTGS
jgi:hypothetical protein